LEISKLKRVPLVRDAWCYYEVEKHFAFFCQVEIGQVIFGKDRQDIDSKINETLSYLMILSDLV